MTKHATKRKPSRKVGSQAARRGDVRDVRPAPREVRPALQSPRRARPAAEESGVGIEALEARAEGETATECSRRGRMIRIHESAAGTRYVFNGSCKEIEVFVPSASYSRVIEDIRGVKYHPFWNRHGGVR